MLAPWGSFGGGGHGMETVPQRWGCGGPSGIVGDLPDMNEVAISEFKVAGNFWKSIWKATLGMPLGVPGMQLATQSQEWARREGDFHRALVWGYDVRTSIYGHRTFQGGSGLTSPNCEVNFLWKVISHHHFYIHLWIKCPTCVPTFYRYKLVFGGPKVYRIGGPSTFRGEQDL